MALNLKGLPKRHPLLKLCTGKTPFFASTLDPRFSFSAYIPRCHSFEGSPLDVLVVVHGTKRQTGGYLTRLQDFCQQNRCALICPLFPAGIIDPSDIHNYKSILFHDIYFDRLLLSMIEQASQTYNIKPGKFYLHGYSGGGQFVHRFLYLHPNRLLGVSIGAPGRITPPNSTDPWPQGLSNVSEIFGLPPGSPDWASIQRVPVQVVVGELDTDESMLEVIKAANPAELEAGNTRTGRARWLSDALTQRGIAVTFAEVPGVAHDGMKCVPAVQQWFERLINVEAA